MGMYTEFHFNAELKRDLPDEVVQALTYMVKNEGEAYAFQLPDHPLFDCSRWHYMLQCDSYYFDMIPNSQFEHDNIGSGSYYLSIRSNFKNYEDEIEKFIDWIKPYLNKLPGDFLGFHRYEETEDPTLIYM